MISIAVAVITTLMSKGIGKLQRRLLAAIEAADPPALPARALVLRELAQLEKGEQVRRVRAIDVAVRRALDGLARRGLLVNLGRFAKHQRSSLVVYATPAYAVQWTEMAEAYLAKKAALPILQEFASIPQNSTARP